MDKTPKPIEIIMQQAQPLLSLPMDGTATVFVYTAKGNLYHVVCDLLEVRNGITYIRAGDVSPDYCHPSVPQLMQQLQQQDDTHVLAVANIMHGDGLEIPYYQFIRHLHQLDPRNTEALVYFTPERPKPLWACLPPKK